MKKLLLSVALFVAAFIVTYLVLCYAPAWRIKLDAEPMVYFLESIKHMAPVKSLISLGTGMIAGVVPVLIRKGKDRQ